MAIDATISGTAANSYLTAESADALAVLYGLSGWACLTDAKKQAALLRAAHDIDSHRVHDPCPYVVGQALKFPRQTDGGIIPAPVKWTAIYQADYLGGNGESDAKNWEGAKASPLKDSGRGSPLCPRAFAAFAKYVSRVGSFV